LPDGVYDPPLEDVYPEAVFIPALRLEGIAAQGLRAVRAAVLRVFKPDRVPLSTKRPESLEGQSFRKVERIADKELLPKGWKKQPLKRGDGVRYTDGKGGSFEINKTGYPQKAKPGDVHGGAYVKTTVGHKIIHIPIKGNPSL
jgi:hypothetical protein